jgi:hypothetical protein
MGAAMEPTVVISVIAIAIVFAIVWRIERGGR